MASVTFLGLVPFCVEPLPEGADTSYAWALTEEEFVYLYWKAKTITFTSSLSVSHGDDVEVISGTFSDTISGARTVAVTETDLICNPYKNSVGGAQESSGDVFYFSNSAGAFGDVYRSGSIYYVTPSFSFQAYNIYSEFEPFRVKGVNCYNGTMSPPSDLGPSTNTYLSGGGISYNGKTCSVIYGAIQEVNPPPADMSLVSVSLSATLTVTEEWPY